jgi:hypothetical protein
MGAMKDLMFERQHLRTLAIEVHCAAGNLERCPCHGDVFDKYFFSRDPPYALANYRINRGETVLPKGVSKAHFSATLKAVAEEFRGIDGCRSCEHLAAE